jgi:hypothetical protein
LLQHVAAVLLDEVLGRERAGLRTEVGFLQDAGEPVGLFRIEALLERIERARDDIVDRLRCLAAELLRIGVGKAEVAEARCGERVVLEAASSR